MNRLWRSARATIGIVRLIGILGKFPPFNNNGSLWAVTVSNPFLDCAGAVVRIYEIGGGTSCLADHAFDGGPERNPVSIGTAIFPDVVPLRPDHPDSPTAHTYLPSLSKSCTL